MFHPKDHHGFDFKYIGVQDSIHNAGKTKPNPVPPCYLGGTVNFDSSQSSTLLGIIFDRERKTTLKATTPPQEENVLELGKAVLRISSGDGRGRPVAHHSLQVCQRKGQAAQCHNRAICTTGASQANSGVRPRYAGKGLKATNFAVYSMRSQIRVRVSSSPSIILGGGVNIN